MFGGSRKSRTFASAFAQKRVRRQSRERSLRDLHKQRQVVQEARVAAAPLSLGRRETVNKFFLFAFCSMNDGCRPVFRSDRACRPVFPAGISRIHFYSEEFDPGSG